MDASDRELTLEELDKRNGDRCTPVDSVCTPVDSV